MRVLFLGRKPSASVALRELVDRGIEVVAVVAPRHPEQNVTATFWRPLLRDTARELGIPVVSDDELYAAIQGKGGGVAAELDLGKVDLVLSFLFWKKLRRPLIELPRLGCFNFHPAPLPEFRGRRGYNFAILEDAAEYGASVHWVTERFDEGDLVEVRRFPIQPKETAFSLERRTMRCLAEIFAAFVDDRLAGRPIPRTPQGQGRSATKAEMLSEMTIKSTDDAAAIDRRVRAFWYPPHPGVTVTLGGRQYTLVDEHTLSLLGRHLHGSREEPC